MYCSENCVDADRISAHKLECNKISRPKPLNLDEFTSSGTNDCEALSVTSVLVRLVSRIGLENIKKTVRDNKPFESFADPRTKGFQDGKFEAINLEALLSLEDNFDKFTSEELSGLCNVSISRSFVCRNQYSIHFAIEAKHSLLKIDLASGAVA